MGIRVRKMVAVGHLVHKYDEIICSIHQGGHPASHRDPPVGGPWWGSFAKTTVIFLLMAVLTAKRFLERKNEIWDNILKGLRGRAMEISIRDAKCGATSVRKIWIGPGYTRNLMICLAMA